MKLTPVVIDGPERAPAQQATPLVEIREGGTTAGLAPVQTSAHATLAVDPVSFALMAEAPVTFPAIRWRTAPPRARPRFGSRRHA